MRVACLIREAPWYRRDAFIRGLTAARFVLGRPNDCRVLLIWNRYGGNHEMALAHERKGGVVWVAENGFLGAGGSSPKFDVHPGGPKAHHYYSLSADYHNGGGRWLSGSERFERLGVALAPWRTSGDYFLVLPNRSFGVPGRIMPPDWAERKAESLARYGVPVKVRKHPGNDEPKNAPLSEDLRGARAAFVWTSSAGVHALAAGIPTFCDAPYWVLKGAAASGSPLAPTVPDRASHFERLAWHQFTLSEIESGWPFEKLRALCAI